MKKLEGKVALITGGSQGIGMGVARAVGEAGARLIITGRTEDKLLAAAAKIRAWSGVDVLTVVGDVRKREEANRAVADAIARFGRLDILVNNAQIMMEPGQKIEDSPDQDIAATLSSGLLGTLYFMQAAFPHMKERGGSIINVGARHAIVGDAGTGIYAMTKEAVRGLSRVGAREWGRYNIRVNVISPVAASPTSIALGEKMPEEIAFFMSQMALGRGGNAYRDIGPIVVFLAGFESGYLTGQTLCADGGQVML